jgi:hypothetical protein
MRRLTFEELLEGEVSISLLNEPPQPVEVEMRLTAREIARRRWKMEIIAAENGMKGANQ